MKVVTYDQLDDAYGFLKLMESAFGWMATPVRVTRLRRRDARYADTFGFAAVDRGRTVGFVGVMDIQVRTLDRGIEKIGGIHAVATDPEFRRTGIATRLFRHAHHHFRRKGYRFTFLCTARNLVGYNLYGKLGYAETPFSEQLKAYRICRPRNPKRRRRSKTINTRLISRVFAETTRDKSGFCARENGWPRVRIRTREYKPGSVITRPGAYAFIVEDKNAIDIEEFRARDRDGYAAVLAEIRRRGKPVVLDPMVTDPVLAELYRSEGFRIRRGRWFTVMCKSLARTSFDRSFGSRFLFTYLDTF